jgi:localization factor PodJL
MIMNTDWKFVEANLPDSDEERTDIALSYIAQASSNEVPDGVDAIPYMEVAFKLLLKITEGGAKVSTAFANLGTIYTYGMGVTEIDHVKAHANFARAYVMGDKRVAHNLGCMCLFGNGVPKDVSKAVEWFKISAAEGNVMSIHNLAQIFKKGADGVAPDAKASEYLYAVCKEIRESGASDGTVAHGHIIRDAEGNPLTLFDRDGNALAMVDRDGNLSPGTIRNIMDLVPVAP